MLYPPLLEYRSGTVLRRWRGSGGNVPLSHLLTSFLYECHGGEDNGNVLADILRRVCAHAFLSM